MIRVDPIVGVWTTVGFPQQVVVGGRTYNKTTRTIIVSSVAAHYRENSEFNARHLYVFTDGTFKITHLDEYNPDMGHVVSHLMFDASSFVLPPLIFTTVLFFVVRG